METSESSSSVYEEIRQMEAAPCIPSRDDNDASRVHQENGRLRAQVVELRERLRRYEHEERQRLSIHRAGYQWQQSWVDPLHRHSLAAHNGDSDMSQSTLTEQDGSLEDRKSVV